MQKLSDTEHWGPMYLNEKAHVELLSHVCKTLIRIDGLPDAQTYETDIFYLPMRPRQTSVMTSNVFNSAAIVDRRIFRKQRYVLFDAVVWGWVEIQ